MVFSSNLSIWGKNPFIHGCITENIDFCKNILILVIKTSQKSRFTAVIRLVLYQNSCCKRSKNWIWDLIYYCHQLPFTFCIFSIRFWWDTTYRTGLSVPNARKIELYLDLGWNLGQKWSKMAYFEFSPYFDLIFETKFINKQVKKGSALNCTTI